MEPSRKSILFAPWPKRIALFAYALVILLTIVSGAVQFTWISGTRASPSQIGIGIEDGRIVLMYGSQLWFSGWFTEFNYDGWKWWIDCHTAGTPRQTYIAVPLWMPLLLFGVLGAALPVFLLRGHCRHCGYDLRGHPPGSQICPECGKPMKPRV